MLDQFMNKISAKSRIIAPARLINYTCSSKSKARLARIRLAKNASGNAFVSRKKEADRLAESGCSIEDLSTKYSAYESQHHHLLSCLEKTTTWYDGEREEPLVRTHQSADFTNRRYQETEYTFNGIPFTRSIGSPSPPLTASPSHDSTTPVQPGHNHAGTSTCCSRWARGNRYEATPTSPDNSDLNDIQVHDPNSNPKKEDLSMDAYPKMNCTTTVTTAIVSVSPPVMAGAGDNDSMKTTTVSARTSPAIVRVSAL